VNFVKKIARLTALMLCLCLLLAGCGATEKDVDGTQSATTTTTKGLISEEEAIAIAEQHFGIKNGSRDDKTGYLIAYRVLTAATEDSPVYHIGLQWLVEVEGVDSHWSMLDTVKIEAIHGGIQIQPE
jgi:predicted small secreted protein